MAAELWVAYIGGATPISHMGAVQKDSPYVFSPWQPVRVHTWFRCPGCGRALAQVPVNRTCPSCSYRVGRARGETPARPPGPFIADDGDVVLFREAATRKASTWLVAATEAALVRALADLQAELEPRAPAPRPESPPVPPKRSKRAESPPEDKSLAPSPAPPAEDMVLSPEPEENIGG